MAKDSSYIWNTILAKFVNVDLIQHNPLNPKRALLPYLNKC